MTLEYITAVAYMFSKLAGLHSSLSLVIKASVQSGNLKLVKEVSVYMDSVSQSLDVVCSSIPPSVKES